MVLLQCNGSLSIIIPTCGRPELLNICLAAVEKSLIGVLFEAEIIVADDDPGPGFRQALLEFPHVRCVPGPRRGPAANRNRGASLASGEWLLFLDDDCVPSEKWVAAFSRHFGGEASVLEGKTITDLPLRPLHTAPTNYSGGCLWSCNFAIRRELFQRMGGFDEGFPFPHLEDVDFRYRLETDGVSWPFIPEAEVFHPQRVIGSDFKLPWHHASNFYFSKKHGVSLALSGLSFRSVAKYHQHLFRGCQTIWQRVRILRRFFLQLLFHVVLVPYWYLIFRGKKHDH